MGNSTLAALGTRRPGLIIFAVKFPPLGFLREISAVTRNPPQRPSSSAPIPAPQLQRQTEGAGGVADSTRAPGLTVVHGGNVVYFRNEMAVTVLRHADLEAFTDVLESHGCHWAIDLHFETVEVAHLQASKQDYG